MNAKPVSAPIISFEITAIKEQFPNGAVYDFCMIEKLSDTTPASYLKKVINTLCKASSHTNISNVKPVISYVFFEYIPSLIKLFTFYSPSFQRHSTLSHSHSTFSPLFVSSSDLPVCVLMRHVQVQLRHNTQLYCCRVSEWHALWMYSKGAGAMNFHHYCIHTHHRVHPRHIQPHTPPRLWRTPHTHCCTKEAAERETRWMGATLCSFAEQYERWAAAE